MSTRAPQAGSSPGSADMRVVSAAVLISILAAAPAAAQLDSSAVARLERPRVLSAAERYLREAPITITAFPAPPSAGGPHDFFSEGDYWWPDPRSPDSPYVRRDGETNPANFVAHRDAMRRLSQIVPALVAAYE